MDCNRYWQGFQLQLKSFQELANQRQQFEQQAEATLSTHPDYCLLKTVPGIGRIVFMTILAESRDLRRFHHLRQFLKYCGLNLAKNPSSNFRGQDKLSKRGNARLLLALYMPSLHAIRQNKNSFRNKFHRDTHATPKDTDCKRKAMTAVMTKMARLEHAVIKSGAPYQSYFKVSPSGSTPLSMAVGATRTP